MASCNGASENAISSSPLSLSLKEVTSKSIADEKIKPT